MGGGHDTPGYPSVCFLQTTIMEQIRCKFAIFKESAQRRFFHRVAMSVYISIYLYVCLSPFHVIFFACNQTGSSISHACNQTASSIGHASILLHAWSLKNGGWVQSWEGNFLRGIRQGSGSCV